MTTHQSLALGFFIAIGLVVGVCGERFEVISAQQLIKVLDVAKANHFDANITLLDDLDFSDSALTLPFGASSDGSCVSYTGVFEGNGHTIKGLVMNNEDNQVYCNAGLFCGLENATFENLVIDSSCSFTGYSAGALSVSLTGSLTAINVTNKADVSGGSVCGGGFIGMITGLNQRTDVTFKDCVNDGNVIGSSIHGGFVGYFYRNTDLTMTLSGCTNNANISGQYVAGGFAGFINSNTNMKIIISNCTNNGNSTGNQGLGGGFVGFFGDNNDMTISISNIVNNGLITGGTGAGGFLGAMMGNANTNMTISNSMNNGNCTGTSGCAGGFTGGIMDSNNMTTMISNSVNTGMMTGLSGVGGFVGGIGTDPESPFDVFHVLHVINSVNKGNASAERFACGLFCVDPDSAQNMSTTVLNSINKGSVNATEYAFGITNIITKARNVVSMGEFNASSDSFTFWNASTDANLFFGLDGKCVNCTDDTTLFVHNTNTGFYEVESGEHVHDLLNAEVEKQNYGMFWTEELELVEAPDYPSPSPSLLPSPSPSSQSGGLSGGNKHGVSVFLISVVVALAAHVAMAQ